MNIMRPDLYTLKVHDPSQLIFNYESLRIPSQDDFRIYILKTESQIDKILDAVQYISSFNISNINSSFIKQLFIENLIKVNSHLVEPYLFNFALN